MSWPPLHHVAKEAEDVGAGLNIFLEALPHYGQEVTACVGELFFISSKLRELQGDLQDPHCHHFTKRSYGIEINTLVRSLQYTAAAFRVALGMVASPSSHSDYYRQAPPYEQVWLDMQNDYHDEGFDLLTRLKLYKTYLNRLHRACTRRELPSEHQRLQSESLHALARRQSMQSHHFGGFTPTPEPRRRSISFGYVHPGAAYVPPPAPVAPEVPLSPTWSSSSANTFSTNQTYVSGFSGQFLTHHWAQRIFDGDHNVTAFERTDEFTDCFGREEPNARQMLTRHGFQQLVEIRAESTQIRISLHWRQNDSRARMLYCNTYHGQTYQYIAPLTALKLLRSLRSPDCMELSRINHHDGGYDLWARIKFTCYERMVLFYCTFKAMKMQDTTPYHPDLEDNFDHEDIRFAGQILHEDREYVLRIFQDLETRDRPLRIEVRPFRGSQKRCPTWTAFISHNVGQRGFIKKVSPTRIELNQVKPYIFSDYFTPMIHHGKLLLEFTTKEERDNFLGTWTDLCEDQ